MIPARVRWSMFKTSIGKDGVSINVKVSDLGVKEKLMSMSSQAPFATAKALTRTALLVRDGIVQEMRRAFDRPTPYVLRSLQVEPATKQRLISIVRPRDFAGKGTAAWRFLSPQVFGGSRERKRSESRLGGDIVPGKGAKLDQYGNISRAQVQQALSAIGVRQDSAQNSPRAGRTRGMKGGTYFATPRGVLLRRSSNRGDVAYVLRIVRRPEYRPRLKYFETAKAVFEKHFRAEFNKAFQAARPKASRK